MDHVFSPSIYGLNAKHKGHELKWKKLGVITHRTDIENNISLSSNINICKFQFDRMQDVPENHCRMVELPE